MSIDQPKDIPIEGPLPDGSPQAPENPPSAPDVPSAEPYQPASGVPATYVVQPNAWDPKIADAIASAIKEVPTLLRERMNTKHATDQAVTVSVLWWSGLLVVGIVLVVGVLTWAGKMSSDATTFLLGVLVGAAFSFVRDFFPNSR